MPKQNLINVFNWACSQIDIVELSMAEENLIFHLLKFMNRNMWEPLKISNRRLADDMHSDQHRTVKPALEKLIKKGIIIRDDEGALSFGYSKNKKSARKDGQNTDTDSGHQQSFESPDSKSDGEQFGRLSASKKKFTG